MGADQQVAIGERPQRVHREIANRDPFPGIGAGGYQRGFAHNKKCLAPGAKVDGLYIQNLIL